MDEKSVIFPYIYAMDIEFLDMVYRIGSPFIFVKFGDLKSCGERDVGNAFIEQVQTQIILSMLSWTFLIGCLVRKNFELCCKFILRIIWRDDGVVRYGRLVDDVGLRF